MVAYPYSEDNDKNTLLDVLRQVALVSGAGLSAYKPPSGPHGSAPSPAPIGAMLTAGGLLLGQAQDKRRDRIVNSIGSQLQLGELDFDQAARRLAESGQGSKDNFEKLRSIYQAQQEDKIKNPLMALISGERQGSDLSAPLVPGAQGPEPPPFMQRSAEGNAARLNKFFDEGGPAAYAQYAMLNPTGANVAISLHNEQGAMKRAQMREALERDKMNRDMEIARTGALAHRVMMDPRAPLEDQVAAIEAYRAAGGPGADAMAMQKYPLERRHAIAAERRAQTGETREQAGERRAQIEFDRVRRARAATDVLYNISVDANATPQQKQQAMSTAIREGAPKEYVDFIVNNGKRLTPQVEAYLQALDAPKDPLGHYAAEDVAAALRRALEDENWRLQALRDSNIQAELLKEQGMYWDSPMGPAVAKEKVDPRTMRNPEEEMSRRQAYEAGNYINMPAETQESIRNLQRVADLAERYQVITSGGYVTKQIAAETGLPEGEIFSGVLWKGGDSDLRALAARGLSAVTLGWNSIAQNKQGRVLNAIDRTVNGLLTLIPKTLGKDVGNTAVEEAKRAKDLFSQTHAEFALRLFSPKLTIKLPATAEQANVQSEMLKGMLLNIYTRNIAWNPYKDINSPDWRVYAEMLPEYLRPTELQEKIKQELAKTGPRRATGRERVVPPPPQSWMPQTQVVAPQAEQPQTAQPQTAQPQTAQPQTAQPQTAQPQAAKAGTSMDQFQQAGDALKEALKAMQQRQLQGTP